MLGQKLKLLVMIAMLSAAFLPNAGCRSTSVDERIDYTYERPIWTDS
ncbi:hypothetical protein SH668x_001319 [Planctomicrobium sp. SH668]